MPAVCLGSTVMADHDWRQAPVEVAPPTSDPKRYKIVCSRCLAATDGALVGQSLVAISTTISLRVLDWPKV